MKGLFAWIGFAGKKDQLPSHQAVGLWPDVVGVDGVRPETSILRRLTTQQSDERAVSGRTLL